MALLSADSFNRANNVSLGSTDGAGSQDPKTWTNPSGVPWGITSNAAKPTGTGFAIMDLGNADIDISLTVVTEGNGSGIVFRYQTAISYWRFVDNFGTLTLDKINVGVRTNVSGDMNVGTNGEVLRVLAQGSSIKVYQGASLLYTATDSFLSTETNVGLFGAGTFGSFDGWSASSLVVVVPSTPVVPDLQYLLDTPSSAAAAGYMVLG